MPGTTFDHISIEHCKPNIAVVRFNRPERLNALAEQTREELTRAFRDVQDDPRVAAVVLTGAGDKAFAAGQDLTEARDFTPDSIAAWIESFGRFYSAIQTFDRPTIAAVNGYALGSGFQAALLCDIRIASASAQFGMPEIDDGFACITGTWTLYDVVGRGRTAELILSGRLLGAEEALAWGLVSEVVPPERLMHTACEWARRLSAKSQTAFRLNKERLRELLRREWESAEQYAKFAHAECYRAGDAQLAINNFLDHRRKGRSR